MKRADEACVIKIGETQARGAAAAPGTPAAAAVASVAASAAAAQPPAQVMVTSGGSTTIFPARITEMPQQPIVAASQPSPAAPTHGMAVAPAAANFTRVIGSNNAVSVYRNDSSVAITAVAAGPGGGAAGPPPTVVTPTPPAAHSGLTAGLPQSIHQAGGNPPTIVTQPPSNIKPESLSKYCSYKHESLF